MIGMRSTKVQPAEDTSVVVEPIKRPVESLSHSNKIIDNKMSNISLNFTDVDVDYLPIIDWLKDNIWLDKVSPFLGNFVTAENIESDISRVNNVLTGKGISGTIEIEKTDIKATAPSKTKVEVSLL